MAEGDLRIGLNGVFKYGTAGSQADTTSNNVDGVTLSIDIEAVKSLRRGKTWRSSKTIAKDASLSFTVEDREGDAFLVALKAAVVGLSRIALYPTDVSGGDGLDADWYITGFNRDENNTEAITYSVTAEPTDELRDPSWS